MARFIFKLPDIGEGIAEAEIVAWHVKLGDRVEEDQQLADMMTDKATVEMPVAGKPQKFDITELVYKACYTLVPPTVAALQDLIATYDPEFQAQMRGNILLGGGGSMIRGLGIAIEEALGEYGGGKVTTDEEPQFAGANGALKFALGMPEEYWKEFRSARSAAG